MSDQPVLDISPSQQGLPGSTNNAVCPGPAPLVGSNPATMAVAVTSPLDLEPAAFAAGLERRGANREVLMNWIRSALVQGTDYGSIPTKRGPSKPSLWKPGAEKICGMLGVTVCFPTLADYEAAALAGKKIESLIIRCELVNNGGMVVASGIGSRSLAQDYGDLNKALKMACKSAHIDATLRMGGLSEVFTQDLEDAQAPGSHSERSGGSKQSPATKTPPSPTQSAAKATPAPGKVSGSVEELGWTKFLGACKTKLLASIPPADYWAWWRYGVDNSWIIPSGESLADGRAHVIFAGYDRKEPQTSIKALVEAMRAKVESFKASCSVELRDELLRAAVPMLAKTKEQVPVSKAPPSAPPEPEITNAPCPNCQSTATKDSPDFEDTSVCSKCGWQWDRDTQEQYEEHIWQKARLPFAPKDPEKAYKGMTLGQLFRIDSHYAYGVAMNFQAKPWNGKPPSQEQKDFEKACKFAKMHLEANATEEKEREQPEDNAQ